MNADLSQSLMDLLNRYIESSGDLPWTEKRVLGELILRERRDIGILESQGALRSAVLDMACDKKWEVRRMIAEMLPLLPDEDFEQAAAVLANDSNAYVKRAAEVGLARRRQAARASLKVRKTANQVDDMICGMQKRFGALAAGRIRKICDKHAELLVGAVAHDLRNILTSLKSDVTGYLSAPPPDPRRMQMRIQDGLEFLEGAIADMSCYAQELPREMKMEALGGVLTMGAEMARSALEERGLDISPVEVWVETEVDLQAEVVRRLIVLATSHIVKNGIEAFSRPDGTFDPGEIRVRGRTIEGQVVVTFENNGPGLDENDITDLLAFLPGRKNKAKQTSRGFGLPTAYRYILHHGGSIDIDSPGGEGAVFTIRLPVTQDQRMDA